MSVIGEGSIRAGRVFYTVTRAVSEEPYILFAFHFLHLSSMICMLPRKKEELGGILYSNVHRSDPKKRVVAVKIILSVQMDENRVPDVTEHSTSHTNNRKRKNKIKEITP